MNKNNLNNKMFLIILLLLLGGILINLVINNNEYNYVDNRMSYRINMPSIKSLLSGDYQNNMEESIADQMPKYNYFKLAYLKVVNYLNISTINIFKLDKLNKYIKINNINLYKDYLLYSATDNNYFKEITKDDIENINKISKNTNANIYLYFVETEANINFENNEKTNTLNYLKEKINLKEENISSFNISSFEDYKDSFYKTDHHWNNVGSYKGYKEIANLMHFDSILKPNDEICFENIDSYGSKTKSIAGIRKYKDKMCIYTFNYPKLKTIINNKETTNYGSEIDDLRKKNQISYGDIYGGDYEEIVFINEDINNNKKLLIYANSYSNAINKLLAASYKETYIIDGRYYKEKNMIDYINDKKIDDVLILGNNMLFSDEISW